MKTKLVTLWAVLLILLIVSSVLPQERRKRKPKQVQPPAPALSVEDSIKLLEGENEKLEQQVRLKRARERNQELREELGQLKTDSVEQAVPQRITVLPEIIVTLNELNPAGTDVDYLLSCSLHREMRDRILNSMGGGLDLRFGKQWGRTFWDFALIFQVASNEGVSNGRISMNLSLYGGVLPFLLIGDSTFSLKSANIPNFQMDRGLGFGGIHFTGGIVLGNGFSLSGIGSVGLPGLYMLAGEIGFLPKMGWQMSLRFLYQAYGSEGYSLPNFVQADSTIDDLAISLGAERIEKQVTVGFKFHSGLFISINAEGVETHEESYWYDFEDYDKPSFNWEYSVGESTYSIKLQVNQSWLSAIHLSELLFEGRWNKRRTTDWSGFKRVDEFWSLRLAVTGEFIKQW